MARKSHAFVVPSAQLTELHEPQLRTLLRRQAILEAEITGLQAKLRVVENDIRSRVGLNNSTVTTLGKQWYEVACAQTTASLYDFRKLEQLVPAKTLARCKKTSTRNHLTVKPVSKDYVLTNYEFN